MSEVVPHKYPMVHLYKYSAETNRDSEIYIYRDDLVDALKEKFGEDIEEIRLLRDGHTGVVFEITTAPDKNLNDIDSVFWRFFQIRDAEAELSRAETKLKKIKERGW